MSRIEILVATSLVIFGATSPGAAQDGGAQPTRSVRDGVYTEEQARQGEETFTTVCGVCHMSEEFTGTFMQSWSGATVGALYELISTTMPQDRPSGLRRRQYAAVLAYIFELNGLPAGAEPLATRTESLEDILIERTP